MYKFEQLRDNRDLWKALEFIPVECSWCDKEFETKYGTLYNVIRRNADGIYCSRKCAGAARADATQKKYQKDGGKYCKRCGEFKILKNFSSLPNPPYFRAECKRCHNYKPARKFSLYKEKAQRLNFKFNLSLDEFIYFWEKPCYYCNKTTKGIRLDLINKEDGYVKGNIIPSCRECQKFKNSLGHKEFIQLCQKISQNVKDSEVRDG